MLGDYLFLAHKVARKPGEPLTSQDAWNCAWVAAKMVETIRNYLPVKGSHDSDHVSWQVQESEGATACNLYGATEAIRNPHKRPFGPGRGTSDSFDNWLDGLPWMALCHAIDRLAEFYGWQDASTGARLPSMPDVRSGQKIPGIDSALLDAVKTPAETICEICRSAADNEQRFAKGLHTSDDSNNETEKTPEPIADEQSQQKVARASDDTQPDSATPTDDAVTDSVHLVTNEQLDQLTLLSVRTFQNKASKTKDRPGPRGKAGRVYVYGYCEQRAWFKKHWPSIPDDRLPETFQDAMNLIQPNCPTGN